MSDFTIRDAIAGDIVTITAIYNKAVLSSTASFELNPPDISEMKQRVTALVKAGYPYLVASDDTQGIVLGYAYAGPYRMRAAYRWTCENSVYLDEAFKGRGIGKELMRCIIERCTMLGFRQMVSVIGGSDNIASIRLHERLGFSRVGVLPATGYKHGVWLDTVLMQRALSEGAATDPDPNSYPGTLYQASV